MKIKNKNLRKYKIKKFIFFKSKLGQEIKIRTLTLGFSRNWDNFFVLNLAEK